MDPLSILLMNYPHYLCVTDLVKTYSAAKNFRDILNNRHYIIPLENYYKLKSIPYTFSDFMECMSRLFLSKGCLKYYTPNTCASNLAQKGNIDLLKFVITKGADDWFAMAEGAAMGGHLDTYVFAMSNIELKDIHWDTLVSAAALGGNVDIFNMVLGVNNTDEEYDSSVVVNCSALGGHLDIFNLALSDAVENPDIEWDEIAESAAGGGNLDILTITVHKNNNPHNSDWIAESAASGGHLNIIKMMAFADFQIGGVNMHITDWNRVAYGASSGGHLDILDFCLSKLGNSKINWNLILENALNNGHLDLYKHINSNIPLSSVEIFPFFKWIRIANVAARKCNIDVFIYIMNTYKELILSNIMNSHIRSLRTYAKSGGSLEIIDMVNKLFN